MYAISSNSKKSATLLFLQPPVTSFVMSLISSDVHRHFRLDVAQKKEETTRKAVPKEKCLANFRSTCASSSSSSFPSAILTSKSVLE